MRLAAQGLDGLGRAEGGGGLDRSSGAEGGGGGAREAGVGAGGAARTPVDVVRRMVAMQGQDLRAVLRAIAIRSAPGTTVSDVRAAFDQGELVRAWAMRGTLFVAAPADLAALHAAVGERMRRQEWRMCTDRGIDGAIAARAAEVAHALLAEGPLARGAMLAAWRDAGIDTAEGRGYHLLALLAYDELLRFGPFDGDEQLLVGGPPPAVPDPQAALADVVLRFALARGPVRADDAAWWLGLPKLLVRGILADAAALEAIDVAGTPMLAAVDAAPGRRAGVRLVPAFDEWLLGYADRSLIATREAFAMAVPGGNGVFRPLVLADGRVIGTWRAPAPSAPAGGAPVVELLDGVPASLRASAERAARAWPHG